LLTTKAIENRNAEGDMLLTIDGVVYDVAEFMGEHPGGPELLKAYIGKDASKAFNGEVHRHSSAAKNRLLGLRAGRASAIKKNI